MSDIEERVQQKHCRTMAERVEKYTNLLYEVLQSDPDLMETAKKKKDTPVFSIFLHEVARKHELRHVPYSIKEIKERLDKE